MIHLDSLEQHSKNHVHFWSKSSMKTVSYKANMPITKQKNTTNELELKIEHNFRSLKGAPQECDIHC